MQLPPFSTILFIIIGLIFIGVVVGTYLKGKNRKSSTDSSPDQSEETESEDELIFDPVSGKYVTVEELVKEHQLNYINDEKVLEIFKALDIETQQKVGTKDVEAILETYYQFTTLASEEEVPDNDAISDLLEVRFQKKGKFVNKNTIEKVISLFEQSKPMAE
jgi:hypothetical protein